MALTGRVLKTTGSWSEVLLDNGRILNCRVKGKLRIGNVTTTNPVIVGDRVSVETDDVEDVGVIAEVADRHNYIVRASPGRKRQRHVLAANIDQAMLVTTLVEPDFKPGFADRFLVTCEAYHIPAVVVLSKEDLWHKASQEDATTASTYGMAGYEVVRVSAIKGWQVDEIRELLAGKTTLVAGQSGVGKSTLINKLIPGLDLKTAQLSGYTGKGIHTTTFACMFALPDGGFLIDTPGVKEWSVTDMRPEELAHYFPEFKALMMDCRFNNCLHVDEPGCAVTEALATGRVAASRYGSYLTILGELRELAHWEIED